MHQSDIKHIWNTGSLYLPLSELIKYDFHTPMGDSYYLSEGVMPPVNGFEAIKSKAELLKQLEIQLSNIGFKRFKYTGHGDFAIVLSTTKNQIIRLSVDSEEHERIVHPTILQPILQFVIPHKIYPLRVEILPQIKDLKNNQSSLSQENIQDWHVELIKQAIYDSNLSPYDVQAKNVALLEDGTPIVIDGGAVSHLKGKKPLIDEKTLENWLMQNPETKLLEWKQHIMLPSIKQHRISGVYNLATAHAIKEKYGRKNLIYQMIENGLYLEEIQKVLLSAEKQEYEQNIPYEKALKILFSNIDYSKGPS